VTDRNLLRSVQNGYFGQPMMEYQEYDFGAEVGTEIWTGSATVPQEVNKDLTTRLPLTEAIGGPACGRLCAARRRAGGGPLHDSGAGLAVVRGVRPWADLDVGVDGLHVFVRGAWHGGRETGRGG
jgi:hypothetical protein